MASLLPLAGVHHLRRLDLVIARIVDRAAHIRLQLAPDDIAVRVPEDAAVRLLLKVEQVHLGAQLAMVALAGLLHPVEVRVELLPVEPAGAVDRSEEHTSELQSLMRISYAVFCLKNKTQQTHTTNNIN